MADNDIAVVAAAWYLLEKNENANIERGKRPYKRRRERRYWIHSVVGEETRTG